MKERPILFSGPMVRALLDGRKTQTRRVVKLDVPADADEVFFWSGEDLRRKGWRNVSKPGLWARRNGRDGYIRFIGPCPYGVPGDRLWGREAWACHFATDDQAPRDIDPDLWSVRYLADGHIRPAARDGSLALLEQCRRGRPSIFMPRWASRLTLEIADVRVERLQDISEADAAAEGVTHFPHLGGWSADDKPAVLHPTAARAYQALWSIINGPGSWDLNPWVWAVSFRVLQDGAA